MGTLTRKPRVERAEPGEYFAMWFTTAILLLLGLGGTAFGCEQLRLERVMAERGVHVQAVVIGREQWGTTMTGTGDHGQALTVRYPVGDSFREVRLDCTEQA